MAGFGVTAEVIGWSSFLDAISERMYYVQKGDSMPPPRTTRSLAELDIHIPEPEMRGNAGGGRCHELRWCPKRRRR